MSSQPANTSFDRWSAPSLNTGNKLFAKLDSAEQQAFLQSIFETAREQGIKKGIRQVSRKVSMMQKRKSMPQSVL